MSPPCQACLPIQSKGPSGSGCPTVPPAVKAAKALHCPLVAPPYADFPTTGAFQLLPQQEGTELEVAKDRVGRHRFKQASPRGITQKGSEPREWLQIIFYLYKKGIFSKRHTKKRVGCGPRDEAGRPSAPLLDREEAAWTKS